MLPHPEIPKYYQNGPRFNDGPKKTKDWANVINLDEYADVGTHCIENALHCFEL